jgi:hypothetical protein
VPKKVKRPLLKFTQGDEYVNECYSSPFCYAGENKVLFALIFVSA